MNTSTHPANACPTCHESTRQHKAGKNHSGSQRFECQHCHRTYTPHPNHKGYELTHRQAALKLYVDGLNFRRIARHLGVHHQSVINWVDQAAARLPGPPTPNERSRQAYVETLELDEIHTFVGQKKKRLTF